MKREMTVEMCGAPRQIHGWRTHVSTAIVPLATLRGVAGKLLIMSKTISHQSDVHVRGHTYEQLTHHRVCNYTRIRRNYRK